MRVTILFVIWGRVRARVHANQPAGVVSDWRKQMASPLHGRWRHHLPDTGGCALISVPVRQKYTKSLGHRQSQHDRYTVPFRTL